LKKLLKILLIAAFWIGLWWGLSLLVGQALLLPSPGAVLRQTVALALTGAFWKTVGVTMLRILCGMVTGTLLGVLLAVLTRRFRLLDALLSPLLTVIKSTPVASFIVLAVIWVGRDLLPSCIVVLMVLPVVWANVSAGIGGTDPRLLEMARVFGFSRGRRLRRVYLPAVQPHFIAAVRSALGLAWKSGVAAEVLTSPEISVGRELMESKLYLEVPRLFSWTLVVILCSLVIEKLLVAALGLADRKSAGQEAKHDSV